MALGFFWLPGLPPVVLAFLPRRGESPRFSRGSGGIMNNPLIIPVNLPLKKGGLSLLRLKEGSFGNLTLVPAVKYKGEGWAIYGISPGPPASLAN
jgi:hypothetical protein